MAVIEATRHQITTLAADLHEVRSACLPSVVVRARVREQIDALAQRGAIDVTQTIEGGLPLLFPVVSVRGELFGNTIAMDGVQPLTGFTSHQSVDVQAVLAWLFRDALIQRLDAEIDELADDQYALSNEESAVREQSLLDALLGAERIEEALVEAAIAEGRLVPRRPDASPLAVLGVSLPGPYQ